ncbi:protein phosphatase 2C domain-containing protein [Melittangium boletus]
MSEAFTTISAFLVSCVNAAPDRDAVASVRDWFAIRTHPGLVRQENQDRVIVARWSQRDEQCWAVAVADGIGSGKAGAEAAATALAAFIGALVDTGERSMDARLAKAGERANEVVYRRWRGKEGTTLSSVYVCNGRASLVNIGDSRIYGIDREGETQLLTRDDVLPTLPGNLLQFVGMGQDLVPHVSVVPSRVARVLLTSDGVHNYVNPLLPHLVRAASTDARLLVDRLTHLSVWCGGADNSTCALAAVAGRAFGSAQAETVLDVWTPGIHHRMSIGMESLRRAKSRRRDGASPPRAKPDSNPRVPAAGRESEPQRAARAPRPSVTMAFDDDQAPPPTPAVPERDKH